jgi:hypothetical protein
VKSRLCPPTARSCSAARPRMPSTCGGHAGPALGSMALSPAFTSRATSVLASIQQRQDVYPDDCGAVVLKWALSLQDQVPHEVEWFVFCSRPSADERAQYRVEATSFISDEHAAMKALQVLDTCPVRERAISTVPARPTDMTQLYAGSGDLYRDGYRWTADKAWMDDLSESLVPALIEAANMLPPWPSHLVVYGWPLGAGVQQIKRGSARDAAVAPRPRPPLPQLLDSCRCQQTGARRLLKHAIRTADSTRK